MIEILKFLAFVAVVIAVATALDIFLKCVAIRIVNGKWPHQSADAAEAFRHMNGFGWWGNRD